jgi:hypothetical protein
VIGTEAAGQRDAVRRLCCLGQGELLVGNESVCHKSSGLFGSLTVLTGTQWV